MHKDHKPNPFQVLGLPTTATKAEIVTRGEELCATSEPDEQLLCRWAIEQLITHPFTRLEYELAEVPDTHYEDEAWNAFMRKHKRNPMKRANNIEEVAPLCLADFNLTALLQLVLEDLLIVPEVNVTSASLDSPFLPDHNAPPLEVQDVIFG
jgi:hypothetical protein